MIILQISPEFPPGTGVGDAWALECEWRELGHDVGSVPEVLRDDTVSRVVGRTPDEVRAGLSALPELRVPRGAVRAEARIRAEAQGRGTVAKTYPDLFAKISSRNTAVR